MSNKKYLLTSRPGFYIKARVLHQNQGFTLLFALCCFLFVPSISQAQSTPQQVQFSVNAYAISLQSNINTSPAVDTGFTLKLNNDIELTQDNIIDPANNTKAFFAGIKSYAISDYLPKLLEKLNIPPSIRFYAEIDPGVSMVTNNSGVTTQAIAMLAGGGIDYQVPNSPVTLSIVRVDWCHIPGLNNSGIMISTGLQLTAK